MRGRKPKPTALKLIEGNRGKRPLNKREPKPALLDGAPLEPPDFLYASAKRHWYRMLPILKGIGILTQADLTAFAAYCQSCSIYEDSMRLVKKMGRVIIGSRGTYIKNPHLRIAKDSLEEMMKFAPEFGTMPGSRSRLKIDQPEESEKDPAAKYFG